MEYFVWPYLFFVLPLPFLIWWLVPVSKVALGSHRPDALRVPFFEQLIRLNKTVHRHSQVGSMIYLGLSWMFLVIAAMRPFYYQTDMPFSQEARNIMLAVDVSTSMNRKDFKVNNRPISRMEIVKTVVRNFILKRQGDKLGLVIFASKAMPLAPLTQDMQALDELFSDIDSNVREVTGEKTAIGDALALSVQNTARIPAGRKVIILLSDGASNSGEVSVTQAIELAKKQNISVYAISLNSNQTSSFLNLFNGETLGIGDKTLKRIADQTGGKYFSVATTDDLISVYRAIDKIETEVIDPRYARPKKELFYLPLMIGLFFWFLVQLQWRKL